VPRFTPSLNRPLRHLLATLAAFALAGSATLAQTPPPASGGLITNDVFWHDTDGNPIYSQGGGIFKFGDTYYWYGVKYNGAVTYYNDPAAGLVPTSGFNAVTCYSSTDLVHWHFENNILTATTPGMRGGWVGRLGVAFNPNTRKYVLLAQGGGGELFATGDTPAGNFTFDHVQRTIPNLLNGHTGDQTVFVDTDGKAYLICSSASGRNHLYVCPLRAADFLSVEPAVQIFSGAGREGNCLFKYNGRYYFCSSDLHGWNASHCYVIDSPKILGPYSSEYILSGTDADFCHVTQTGFFVNVPGAHATTVLFCGDRWCDFAGNGLGYNQWCPLSFNGTKPRFNSVSQFNLDTVNGTWTVGPANNYILNPGFEADRVEQSSLAGWASSPNPAPGGPNRNTHDAHTGRWSLEQFSNSAYDATMTQAVTHLPPGNYTLTAWVKSSGGQKTAEIFARGFGGEELDTPLNHRLDQWTQITLPNLTITTGQCILGLHSAANPGDWLEADDFSLTRDY
jgi:hypothetical protein